MRFSMLYSGEQILSFKSCLVFYAGDSLKKHMLGFEQIISVFRTGWRFALVGVGYPVSGTCSRSSFCKWQTGACWF